SRNVLDTFVQMVAPRCRHRVLIWLRSSTALRGELSIRTRRIGLTCWCVVTVICFCTPCSAKKPHGLTLVRVLIVQRTAPAAVSVPESTTPDQKVSPNTMTVDSIGDAVRRSEPQPQSRAGPRQQAEQVDIAPETARS